MTLTISNLLSPASRRNASIPNDSALFFLLSVFLEFTGYAWLCMREVSSVFLFTKERGGREGKAMTNERKANWREESQRELLSFRLHSGTLLLLEPVFPSSRAQMIPRSNFFPFLFFFPPEEICFSQMVLLSYGALFSTPFSLVLRVDWSRLSAFMLRGRRTTINLLFLPIFPTQNGVPFQHGLRLGRCCEADFG